jgi:hypothetical protein
MNKAKIITIYTSLVILVTITIVGIYSGNTNLLIAPGLAVVVALFNAKHIFEDPEATTKLKDEHSDAIRGLKLGHADVVAEIRSEHAVTIAGLEKDIASLNDLLLKKDEEQVKIIAKKDTEIARERDARNKAEKERDSRPPPDPLACLFESR